ncbi:hypothetical protein GCM10027059_12650 [Myceligenerans halotolerans]
MSAARRVGWFLPRALEARAIWFDPAPYVKLEDYREQKGLIRFCPASRDFSKSLYTLRSPFDLHLLCELTDDGCTISVGEKSSIRAEKLAPLLKVHPRAEWRHPDRPLMQVMLNYYFISDDDVAVQYLSPLATTYFEPALPGLVLQGRWNIRSWVRPVNFVFEWWAPSAPLFIARGKPILNLMFLPSKGGKVELIEAEETDDVVKMARSVQNVNSYIKNVYSVMPSLLKRRPKKLVRPWKT